MKQPHFSRLLRTLGIATTIAHSPFIPHSAASEPNSPSPTPDEIAILETSLGNITIEFWHDVAPQTVKNFKSLAKKGFYDGTLFHRIIPGFMAQGGDPLTKNPSQEKLWGTGGPGYTIRGEFHDRHHTRGVISMARTSDPDSAGSQFFLMFAPAPHLDGKYAAFGKMLDGEETLRKIEQTPIGISPSGEPSKPLEPVKLLRVTILPRQQQPTTQPTQQP